MSWIWYLCGIIAGYFIGCINTGAIIARIKGFDIRDKGTGNAGASNALVTMGTTAGVLTAWGDIMKAFIPVFLLKWYIPVPSDCRHLAVVVGISIVAGHMFPFWMEFRGGKGFASLLGLTLGLNWRLFLIAFVILVLALFITRYIALATIICALVLPICWYVLSHDLYELLMLLLLGVFMIVKHIENIHRIADGTEIRFGSHKGKTAESAEAVPAQTDPAPAETESAVQDGTDTDA